MRFALTSILSQEAFEVASPSAAPPPLWIPAPYRGTGHAFDRGNDECEGIPALTKECRNGGPEWRMRRLPENDSIPDRSPGHAFVAIADAGWCRHTEGMKIGCIGRDGRD